MLIAVAGKPLDTWLITVCFSLPCVILDSIKNLVYGHIGVMVQSFPVDTDHKFFVSSLLCHIMGVPFWQWRGRNVSP